MYLLICVQLFADNAVKKLTFDFYGYMLEFSITTDFYIEQQKLSANDTEEQKIMWMAHDPQLMLFKHEADVYGNSLKLDDISYLMLIKKAAAGLSRGNEEFEALFTYAILKKKGLDVLIGTNEDRITLYGNTGFAIKNVLFVTQNSKVYYDLSFDQHKPMMNEQLLNLPGNNAGAPIMLNRFFPPEFNKLSKTKILPYEYDGYVYFFTIILNQSLVRYYNDLPDIELGKIYLNYGLSEKGNNTLVHQLKQATEYMSKQKTVDFILGFVQNMEYARDEDVIGKEKFAFPEESLAGEYTDCEDRSMLFAYLVREVAHLQSIGLLYSSHMNVAVESWKKRQDSDFSVYEMDFVVCEPSAKGLKAGQQTMNLSSATIVKW